MNQGLLLLFLAIAARAAALRRQQTLVVLFLVGCAAPAGQPGAHATGVFAAACAELLRHGGGVAGREGAEARGDGEWQRRVYNWPDKKFRRYYRVKRARFHQLCSALAAPQYLLLRTGSRNGKVITIEQVVGACLRRLATGDGDFFSIAEAHGMAESTLQGRFAHFLRAMRLVYEANTIALPTAAELPAVMKAFEEIAGLPQCCGALDGTHVAWRPVRHRGLRAPAARS